MSKDYFDGAYFIEHSQVWDQFKKGKIGLQRREDTLKPMRSDLYTRQFPHETKPKVTRPDHSMSRAEMIAWSKRQGVASRKDD